MRMNDGCRKCQLERKLNAFPAGATQQQITQYQASVMELVTNSGSASSPEIASRISAVYRRLFGPEMDYGEIKRHFNALMMSLWPVMQESVEKAPDPLERAIQLSMTGNFIDFVALDHVDEDKLKQLLRDSHRNTVDPLQLEEFRQEIRAARRLVFFTDNCGEIVTDKLLIETIRKLNPEIHVTVIVRGEPVANDATLEDAEQVHLEEAAQEVIGSGNDIPGAALSCFSKEAADAAKAADLLVSKGQGNYEGLSGCGLNIFYIFMCKCSFFMERFGVKQFTGILTKENKELRLEHTKQEHA